MTPLRSKPRKTKKKSSKRRAEAVKSSKVNLLAKTQFAGPLAWLHPYLRKAYEKMPNLNLPNRVRSFKPSRRRIMRVLGNAYFAGRIVVIATHTQQTYLNKKGHLRVKKIVRLPKAQILDTFAHEIAHFHYPDHGYEHEEFTRAIFKTFGLKEKCPHCKGSGKVQLEGKPY